MRVPGNRPSWICVGSILREDVVVLTLTEPQQDRAMSVLCAIGDYDEGLSIGEIRELFGLSLGEAGSIIKWLSSRGWLREWVRPMDGKQAFKRTLA